MRKLSIGIDGNEANTVRSDIGARVGVNQYAFGLLHALYNLDKKNHYRVYLEEKPRDDLPGTRANWEYKVTGPSKFWTQWRLPLELFLAKERLDLFFTPSHYAPRFSPVPRVVSIMDLGFYRFPQQFKKRDLWQLKSWTEYSVKKAAQVLAISESTKEDIVKFYQIKPEKITVTYPGYDREKFNTRVGEEQKKKVKEKYKIADEFILFLSTLKPSKNIEGLVEAFSLLKTQHPNTQLVIAGSKGWLYESIFAKVKKLGMKESVLFTGFVPDEDVPSLMALAKTYVLPSFWEGFGIPVVEAMAVGTPVVVSSAGSLPEVVGEAGVVTGTSPKQIVKGISKILKMSPKEYKMIQRKGVRRAQKFSWQGCAEKTLEVLEKVAK